MASYEFNRSLTEPFLRKEREFWWKPGTVRGYQGHKFSWGNVIPQTLLITNMKHRTCCRMNQSSILSTDFIQSEWLCTYQSWSLLNEQCHRCCVLFIAFQKRRGYHTCRIIFGKELCSQQSAGYLYTKNTFTSNDIPRTRSHLLS